MKMLLLEGHSLEIICPIKHVTNSHESYESI